MNINAVAYYKYHIGGFVGDYLTICVKFKIKGKLFRVKLERTVASVDDGLTIKTNFKRTLDSKEEFLDYVEQIITDKEYLKEKTTQMVKEWYKSMINDINKNNKEDIILDQLSNQDEVEVSVKVGDDD